MYINQMLILCGLNFASYKFKLIQPVNFWSLKMKKYLSGYQTKLAKFCALTVGLMVAYSAQAALVVTPINDGSLLDNNVLFNSCNAGVTINGPATLVAGCFNGIPAQQVRFTADENVLVSGGQARVDLVDANGYSQLRTEVVGQTFTSLILNITDLVAGATVVFTDGISVSSAQALTTNGNNFFTITGGTFSFIQYTTSVGGVQTDVVQDTRQVRIGGLSPVVTVPVPGSLALLGLGAFALGFVARRKK
jgi:hypothetical protein